MRFLALQLAAILIFCSASPGQSATDSAVPGSGLKDRVEKYVRHLFVWGPEVKVEVSDLKPSKLTGFQEVVVTASAGNASQKESFYISSDGSHLVRGVSYDLSADPYADTNRQIDKTAYPAFGPESAPVQLVVYSDFQCSFCRAEAKILREDLAKAYPDQVRVIFKDFPLDAIHPWARPASIAGHCIYQQDQAAFWPYHDWVFENQQQITVENFSSKVSEYAAKQPKLDAAKLVACLEKRATEAKVNESMAEAAELGVNSTPTLFVNGRKLVGQVGWEVLNRIIQHEIAYQKETGKQACCELKLPAPAGQ